MSTRDPVTVDFIVVGSGVGALVTAQTLRQHGKSVVRIGAAIDGGTRTVGTGWCAEAPPAGFDAAPAPARALLLRGQMLSLPLSPASLGKLLPAAQLARAGVALGRARASSAVAAFVGGGREERTYRDWVRYRFGNPVYEAVFAPYATARFGDPTSVICGVARVVHGEAAPQGSRPPAALWVEQEAPVDAVVTALRDGGLSTEAGDYAGQVVVDLAPLDVLRVWSPKADSVLALDAGRLRARHGLEVLVRGQLPDGLEEVHVVGAPFFRAVQHADGMVALHLAVDVGAPEWTGDDAALARQLVQAATDAGLTGLSADGATVRRLPLHHPLWTTSHLTRLRTWTEALVEGGIEPVGRVGLVAPMSPAAIAAYAEDRLIHGASLRDCIRHHVEPPPRDSVDRPRLSGFITR
jgi:hypothetical protein